MTNYEHLIFEQQILTKEIAALRLELNHAPKAGLVEHMVFGGQSPIQRKLNHKVIELENITKRIIMIENEIMNKSYINNSADFLVLESLTIYKKAKEYYNRESLFTKIWDKLNSDIEFETSDKVKNR